MVADLKRILVLIGLLCHHVIADFNSALNDVGQSCKSQVNVCIARSSKVKELVDNQIYCAAILYESVSFSSKTCLVTPSGCSNFHYYSLMEQACYAIGYVGSVQVSFDCQRQTEICLSQSYEVQLLYSSQKYCNAIQYNSGVFSSKNCLVTEGYCTQDEYNRIYSRYCNSVGTSSPVGVTSSPVSNNFIIGVSVSSACYNKAASCFTQSTYVYQLYISLKYCEALTYSTSKPCLVTSGGCTEDEYNNVKSNVCAPSSSTTNTIGDVTVSSSCFSQTNACLAKSSTVQVLYDSQQYCAALTYSTSTFTSKTCLIVAGGCSEDEYNKVKSQKCHASFLTAGAAALSLSFIINILYI